MQPLEWSIDWERMCTYESRKRRAAERRIEMLEKQVLSLTNGRSDRDTTLVNQFQSFDYYRMHGIRGVIRYAQNILVWVEWEGWCHLTHNSWEFLDKFEPDKLEMLQQFENQVPEWYRYEMTIQAAKLWHEIWYGRVTMSEGLDVHYFHSTHKQEHEIVEAFLANQSGRYTTSDHTGSNLGIEAGEA